MGFRRAREFLACLQIELPRGKTRKNDDLGASAVRGKLQIPVPAALAEIDFAAQFTGWPIPNEDGMILCDGQNRF